MPFRSKAQARYLFAKHPEVAEKWAAEGYNLRGLPEKKAPEKAPAKKK